MNQPAVKTFLSILALLITAALFYSKIFLNSDSLFLESLFLDLFSHGGAWADWKLTPAPAYFPDMLLYFLAHPLLPNAIWRIFFVSFSQVLMLAAAVVWCARKIYPQMSQGAAAILILLVAYINLVAANSNMWLYFYTTNNHFAALLFALFSLGLYIRFFETQKKTVAAMLIVFGVIAQLSTAVYSIAFVFPAFILFLGMFIFYWITKDRKNKIILTKMLLILIISYTVAELLQPFITYNHPLDGRVGFSLARILASLHVFKLATQNAFALDNRYTALLSYSIIISFIFTIYRLLSYLYFQWRTNLINQKFIINVSISTKGDYVDHKITLAALFFIITIAVNTAGAILSGGFLDIFGFRYLTFPVALSIIITVIMWDKRYPILTVIENIIYFILLVCVLISSIYFFPLHKELSPIIQKRDVASCLESVENKGFTFQAGISDYWNARGVTSITQKEIPILATTNDLQPFFWMSTIGPLKRPKHYPEYNKYNFVIVQEISPQFQYTPDILGKILPPPDKVEFCSDTEKTQIWLYESDTLDVRVKSAIQQFLKNKKH